MKRLIICLLVAVFAFGVAAADDATHPFKTYKGKIIDMPWWETMASCYGQLQALSNHAAQSDADAAKKLGDYSTMAFNLALARLVKDRGISLEQAQEIVVPNARQAAQITTQGFTIYKMAGTLDEKNDGLINKCFVDFNAYAKAFPGELKAP